MTPPPLDPLPATFRRAPELGVDVIRARRVEHGHGVVLDVYVVGVVDAGEVVLRFPSGRRRFRPGDVYVSRPGRPLVVDERPTGFTEVRTLMVEADRVDSAPPRTASPPKLQRTVHQVSESLLAGKTPQEVSSAVESLHASLRGHFEREAAGDDHDDWPVPVRAARDLISSEYAKRRTLEELSQRVGMDKFQLVRLFHHHVGLPPHAYLNAVRVGHARRLLVEGASVAEVAGLTGFSDQSHLTRHFKRVFGFPPGQYRKGTG